MTKRILVVGNCQVPGLAALLQHMIPGASVESFTLNGSCEAKADLANRLEQFDIVFSHPHRSEVAGPLALRELQTRHPHVVPLPRIVFSGFHPDFIDCSGMKEVESAASHYHSLIVAAAALLFLPSPRSRNR